MSTVAEITCLDCAALIAVVLFKPSIRIKGRDISIYWSVVLLGAIALVVAGCLSLPEIFNGLTDNSSINPIKILVLFISMTTLSIFLDEVGMFKYLANVALKKANASQKMLFTYLYIMVSLLTVFTSNDIIILTFTPFICYFAKNAKINPIPYLFGEFVAANTWSMMLVIGNPTNVYLATASHITFGQYTAVMWLPTIFAGITAFIVLFIVFGKDLSKKMEIDPQPVNVKSRGLLYIGLAHLSLCTVLLVASSYLKFEMWSITLLFATSLFICVIAYKSVRHIHSHVLTPTLKRAPWELIPFVLSMFVLVLALDKYDITGIFADLLGQKNVIFKYGFSSFFSANLINNIPMSVLFTSITSRLGDVSRIPAVYASIIGSNIGAFLSPLGALAGIMWSGILKKHGVSFSFLTYIKYGFIISIPTITAALIGLSLVL